MPPSPPLPAGRVRIPALDGLRGLAIALVFSGHIALFCSSLAEQQNPVVSLLARNNGLGVDLFFVLSGFLITGILYDSKGSPYYFRKFYARRTLRIFPLYYSVLAVVAVATYEFPNVYALRTITTAAQLSNWTYTSNILIALHGWGAEPMFLAHFWSLAVEEQFYLLWPVFVLILDRRHLVRICGFGIVAAFVIRTVLVWKFTYESAYVLLPARMDALLIGALVALWTRGDGVPAWAGSKLLTAVIAPLFLLAVASNNVNVPGFAGVLKAAGHFSVTSIAFGLLVIRVQAAPQGMTAQVFKFAPARFFGKYSYAIYVFHLAIIEALPSLVKRLSTLGPGHVIVPSVISYGVFASVITIILALTSWILLERPFLMLKDRLRFGPSQRAELDRTLSGMDSRKYGMDDTA